MPARPTLENFDRALGRVLKLGSSNRKRGTTYPRLRLFPHAFYGANAFYIDANLVQCPASTRPVFRLYNNGMGGEPNHRYVTSWPVIDAMQTAGWVLEGVVFCAPL